MNRIDVDELKKALTAVHARRRGSSPFQRPVDLPGGAQATTHRRGIEGLLKSFYTKAGLDVEKLDKMLGQRQSDARGAFAKRAAEAAKHASRDKQALRHGIEGRRKAFQILHEFPITPPAGPTLIVLDKPFLIWETPSLEENVLINSNVESMNSSLNIKVNTNSGSDYTLFNFYFLWENESSFYAVVNVDTSLILNGICEVSAATGFFSGDSCYLSLAAQLSLLEWWDQTDGVPAQPLPEDTTYKSAAYLTASGGGLFSSPDIQSQMFVNQPVGLSYDLFAVPGDSVAIFEVSLIVQYGFISGGEDTSDLIFVDFADGPGNRSIICPSVTLELLTAPPSLSAT